MLYFIFKGIDSRDYSEIIVNKLPFIQIAPRRYNIEQIDGIDGAIYTDYGLSPYEKEMTITLVNHNRIDEVTGWLQGKGKIIFGNEPDKYYFGIINGIQFTRPSYETKISIIVQPYKYEQYDEFTTNLEVYNKGNVTSNPRMTIYGTGNVKLFINGIETCNLTLSDYITLDSEEQDAFHGTSYANNLMSGEFPVLKPGINIVSYTGNVSKIETTVRSRWI